MLQTQNAQNIPESKPNQQCSGVIYVNFKPEPLMTLEQLDKYIIYLMQIRRYAVNNNVLRIALKQNSES
jgi:hypothetical protein